MKNSKYNVSVFIVLGGIALLVTAGEWKMNKDLQQQPPLYLIGCSQKKHGLYMLDTDLKTRRLLNSEYYDSHARLDYQKEETKLMGYVPDRGIVEYELKTRRSQVVFPEAELQELMDMLKPEKRGNLQFCSLKYLPNSNKISFVYGNWGWDGGRGKLYVYDKKEKGTEEICELNTQGGYHWAADTNHLYRIENRKLLCKNLVTGEEKELIKDVENFEVSAQEDFIAVWRDRHGNRSSYCLHIWDRKTGKEKHIMNARFWGGMAFSPDGNYLAYLSMKSGVLGSILNGSKPVLSVYDIRRKRIVKCRQGDYEDIWGGLSWGGDSGCESRK